MEVRPKDTPKYRPPLQERVERIRAKARACNRIVPDPDPELWEVERDGWAARADLR